MNRKKNHTYHTQGFIALTAIILLASGIMAFSVVGLVSAVQYADAIERREFRIQAGLYLTACLDSAELIVAKGLFAQGTIRISDINCELEIKNTMRGYFEATATTSVAGVNASWSRIF